MTNVVLYATSGHPQFALRKEGCALFPAPFTGWSLWRSKSLKKRWLPRD